MKINLTDLKHINKLKLAGEQLLSAVRSVIKGEPFFSPEDLAEQRLDICKNCPELLGNSCSMCGCIISGKVKVLSARCPKGYWKEKIIEKLMTGNVEDKYINECCK